jgi:Raf kinase inhibitor-like YbhB/YbcL family protein
MSEPHVKPATYGLVFVGLLALTGLTIWLSSFDLGVWHVPVGLAIAATKATLIALIFMHILYSTRLTWMVALTTLMFLGILLIGTLNDYLTRDWQTAPVVTTGGAAMTIELTSIAFTDGEIIPKQHTGDGKDTSPPLKWSDPPSTTKSLALICDDPDAPRGTWVHWVLYNLPPEARELPEGVPTKDTLANGAKQGTNDFRNVGYGGPAPPKGNPHRYYFKLYALDTMLELPAKSKKAELEKAMQGHIVAEGQLMGRYGR